MKLFLTHRLMALALCLSLVNCATNPVTGESNFVVISEEQEIAIGRNEDLKVTEEHGGIYNDPQLQRYVETIGQRLAAVSHRPNVKFYFRVVDSPMINAFALPGGYVYITRGILSYLNSEAELAAVLGHEIGHVTARHSVQQISAAQGANIAVTVASILVPGLQNQAAQGLINVLGGAWLSGYGRDHELEADRLGAEYLARAGYDPQAMIRVVGVLKDQELFDAETAKAEGRQPRSYHGVFASHPSADARLQQVVGEAARFAQGTYRDEREVFLKRMDRVPFGDSPDQGFVRAGTFYHPKMGFVLRFPRDWKVGNFPDRVVARSPQQDAVLELRLAGPARGTPSQVLQRTLRLGIGSDLFETEVNGLPAAVSNTSIQGRPTHAAVIFLGGQAYLLGAQARDARAMNVHRPDITNTVRSFHAMTESERRLARPLTLRIINATPGMTYAALAQNSPIGKYAEQYLRLINAQYPRGEPRPGQALKVVE
jgi:predicted Zn-dependent protease